MAQQQAQIDPKEELQELKQMIGKARKRAVSFAIALGKGKEEPAFLLHLIQRPQALRRQAKTETGSARGAHGKMTVDGKYITLDCLDDDPPPILFKVMKRYLKDRKLPYKFVLKGPGGQVVGESEVLEPGAAANEDEPDPSDPREAIKALLPDLMADLAALEKLDPETAAKLRKLAGHAAEQAKKGDLQEAMRLFDSCTTALGKAQTRARGAQAAAAIPEGRVAEIVRRVELARSVWQTQRMRTITGLDDLIAELRDHEDSELQAIAGRIAVLSKDIPAQIDAALEKLGSALETGEPTGIETAKAAVLKELGGGTAYLTANRTELVNCEENPFGIKLAIVQPLAESLKAIRTSIGAI